MRNISKEELNKILKEHELWLKGEGGKCADLSEVDLKGANLSNVDLSNADLKCADLKGAYLRKTNLNNVNLENANLEYVDLGYANLENANLCNVNLRHSVLRDANLKNVRTNIHAIGYNLACPEKGSFIGYKKANGCLIELLILEDSKRSSATTTKCRCDKAKVLEIRHIETGKKVNSVCSNFDNTFIYKVGEIVSVDNFDDDRWHECSTGIHFFMNRENALNYL